VLDTDMNGSVDPDWESHSRQAKINQKGEEFHVLK
jgi:hypothetical protein